METKIIKRAILMSCFMYTQNTWSKLLQRYEEGAVRRKGRVINFEGTEKEFDTLTDELYRDESNGKVIGIYQG